MGHNVLIDPSATELLCSSCSLTFFVEPQTGKSISMQKGNQGQVEVPTIEQMLAVAGSLAKKIGHSLLSCLEREEKASAAGMTKSGFFVSRTLEDLI